jgi:hypothetical protein
MSVNILFHVFTDEENGVLYKYKKAIIGGTVVQC